jgi:DNA-binding response OmpR family regulator
MSDSNKIDRDINILVAEDEENIGDLLLELLSQENRHITLARDGREAVFLLEQKPYDLLITDLMMPEVDGMEVLHKAKELYPDIMVIIITGYASLETAIQAVKQGAYDYLRKPFRLEELKISVDNACEKILLKRENEALLRRVKGEGITEAASEAEAEPPQQEQGAGEPQVNQGSLFGPEWYPPSYFESDQPRPDMVLDELERLGNLLNQGLITEEEFSLLKKKLFKKI